MDAFLSVQGASAPVKKKSFFSALLQIVGGDKLIIPFC